MATIASTVRGMDSPSATAHRYGTPAVATGIHARPDNATPKARANDEHGGTMLSNGTTNDATNWWIKPLPGHASNASNASWKCPGLDEHGSGHGVRSVQ